MVVIRRRGPASCRSCFAQPRSPVLAAHRVRCMRTGKQHAGRWSLRAGGPALAPPNMRLKKLLTCGPTRQ
jgi:hypothetical protein